MDLLFIDGEPADLQLPSAVDLEVTQTEPGLRGDTASGGGTKPATLETGAAIQVPLFVGVGERIRVDTRSGDVRLTCVTAVKGRARRASQPHGSRLLGRLRGSG